MSGPTLQEEKKLWKLGYKNVAGLDEAGRGPLAGPVVAAAVVLTNRRTFLLRRNVLRGVKDSKQLSAAQREVLYQAITRSPEIRWGIGIVSEKIIDKINILEATKLAMLRALENASPPKKRSPKIDYLILDGKIRLDSSIKQKSLVKADVRVFSCAAASILAKVTRDRIMQKLGKEYPRYGFERHKGYGTLRHYKMLKKNGPCRAHRRSFTLYK